MIIMRYEKDEGKNTNVKSRTVKLQELENQVSSGLQRDLETIWSSLYKYVIFVQKSRHN